jgi:hypothetical protein
MPASPSYEEGRTRPGRAADLYCALSYAGHGPGASIFDFLRWEARTKRHARRLARAVATDGFAVAELHGNLTQPQRDRAMEGFRRGAYQVLVGNERRGARA